MPGVRGIIVTTVGFQKGAVDYATTHQIGLKVIRPPQDEDWTNRIRTIALNMRINTPQLLSCEVTLNKAWIKENITEDTESLAGGSPHDASTTTVRDLKDGSISDMNALWNRAMRENHVDAGKEGRGVLRWDDARFERPGEPSVRVDEIAFEWKLHEGEVKKTVVRSEPQAIVRDAIAGTLLFVDPNGRITGDVEEEFGTKSS
jgi:hypothetical protein